MNKKTKTFFVIISVLFLFGFILHFSFFDVTYFGKSAAARFYYVYGDESFVDENGELKQSKVQSKMDEMLLELGNYDSYKLNMRKRIIAAVFTDYGMTLTGSFSENNYKKQKEYIINNYTFANKNDDNIFKYDINDKTAFEFDYNDWNIKLLNEDDGGEYYIPEYFRMVGFNDKENKIAFLTFADSDQDCFGEFNDESDLREFVKESFRFK